MRIELLGTTGYHPNEQRQTACFMLPEIGVVLDAGTGMFRVRERLVTSTLDIFLTHAHLDHVIGLTYLFDILHDRKMDRVTVHAMPEKITAIQEHLLNKAIFPVKLPCEFRPLTAPVELGNQTSVKNPSTACRLTFFPLVHPGECVGFRLDWADRSMAYVTDTVANPTADYVRAIENVDLLIHECYFPDGWEEQAKLTGHSCLTPVAQVAAKARAKRCVLVHVNPLLENGDLPGIQDAKKIFPELHIGEDHQVWEI